MLNELYLSECFEKIKTLPDNSVGSIVSDPPYLIDFMNKKWDNQESPVGKKEFWLEVKRVLKPGAHCAIFGHSRTHHRVMVAMEDAGFEIRDTMMWLYGSGFPKSHNIGKAIDKLEGNKREVVGNNPNHRETDALYKLGFQGGKGSGIITKGNSKWEGWGTALKPAYEPIIIARKPIEKKLTVAKNVLKWGVGGINIEGCRVGTEQMPAITTKTETTAIGWEKKGYTTPAATGRFPANVMIDEESGKMLDEQSKEASRFFYCPKVSKKERNVAGKNNHPTVKPIALMGYLIRLITPPGEICFDPFMGSGTTGMAAVLEERDFIGIEMNEDYLEIAKARIEWAKKEAKDE